MSDKLESETTIPHPFFKDKDEVKNALESFLLMSKKEFSVCNFCISFLILKFKGLFK